MKRTYTDKNKGDSSEEENTEDQRLAKKKKLSTSVNTIIKSKENDSNEEKNTEDQKLVNKKKSSASVNTIIKTIKKRKFLESSNESSNDGYSAEDEFSEDESKTIPSSKKLKLEEELLITKMEQLTFSDTPEKKLTKELNHLTYTGIISPQKADELLNEISKNNNRDLADKLLSIIGDVKRHIQDISEQNKIYTAIFNSNQLTDYNTMNMIWFSINKSAATPDKIISEINQLNTFKKTNPTKK